MPRGKIFVIEGTDASGKATQCKMLIQKLHEKNIEAEFINFPRYDEFFGSLVAKYLRGDFGSKEKLPAEFSALLYALDRYDAMPAMGEKLNKGITIVLDRYSASNYAHQSSKFKDEKKQQLFLQWVKTLESRLPSPTATVFLDMHPKAALQLMQGREPDQHEADLQYQLQTHKIYKQLASSEPNWITIECATESNGKWTIKSKEEISNKVWQELQRYI